MAERGLSDDQLTRELRRRRLTFAQRRKHLERLERAIAAGEDEMEFLKRRSRTEFVALAAAVAVLLVGVVVWTVALDEADTSDEPPDILAMAGATLTARGLEATTQLLNATPTVVTTPTSGQWSGVCDVDLPVPVVPPYVPQGDPTHDNWYGDETAGLWVAPSDPAGLLPEGVPEPRSIWFSGATTYLFWYGTSLPLTVTGEQLDGDATIGPVEATDQRSQMQWANISFPEPGCWQIEGTTDEGSLTLTVEVLPIEQRVDVLYLKQLYAARPYEIPSTCPVTPLTGPEERFNYNIVQYWLDADDIGASLFEWPVANQQLTLGVFGRGVTGEFSATARTLGAGLVGPIEASTSIWNSDRRLVRYTFPEAGCWELELSAPETTATFVVYVYPEACMPDYAEGKFIVECEAPQP